MKNMGLLLCMTILVGCSTTPVMMEIKDETILRGDVTYSLGGSFKLKDQKGLECDGSYAPHFGSYLDVSFTCNDGRTGEVQMTLVGFNKDSGSGVGTLSDGSKVRVLLGLATLASAQHNAF
ncbi:hypothetical protein DI392_11405 [Vibrio albus]|uniref:Lipoprotein n=1 Tax=Vibrio albus TaxID=2200953 RepID=A0A2U3B9P9_9VIBR|nr:hypothetical protein [Vibrio albus]PWI33444.1 hypothetical protein DI392_11405 [Vibrio albus]